MSSVSTFERRTQRRRQVFFRMDTRILSHFPLGYYIYIYTLSRINSRKVIELLWKIDEISSLELLFFHAIIKRKRYRRVERRICVQYMYLDSIEEREREREIRRGKGIGDARVRERERIEGTRYCRKMSPSSLASVQHFQHFSPESVGAVYDWPTHVCIMISYLLTYFIILLLFLRFFSFFFVFPVISFFSFFFFFLLLLSPLTNG